MNANQPAYPVSWIYCSGLTKRELIAAMALQGILANDMPWDNAIIASINYADALLAKLEETKPK